MHGMGSAEPCIVFTALRVAFTENCQEATPTSMNLNPQQAVQEGIMSPCLVQNDQKSVPENGAR